LRAKPARIIVKAEARVKTILIIDDDPIILQVLSEYLSQEGYRTVTALEGRAGLAAFAANTVDAVLCDLAMPGLGGLGVLAEVRSQAPLTPFVVFSGSNDVSKAVEALRLGAWDYLLKPLPGLELLPPLLNCLEERAAFLREKELYQSRLEEQIKVRTAQLLRQLKEKDLLLAEVHHRVKNNLQIILVLLGLQHDQSDDPQVRQALRAHQDRIHALAMVQEEMHDPDHATLVNASSYAAGLIHHLLAAHNLSKKLDLKLDLDDLDLTPGQAFTLGLVLNELTACLADGASDGPWRLEVGLNSGGPGVLVLRVTETRGVWKSLVPGQARPPLGWVLVSALASSQGGSIAWDPAVPETITVRLS
jgi:two-component sensor histidine kinase